MGIPEEVLPWQISGLGSYPEELSSMAPEIEQEGQADSGEVPLPRVGMSATPISCRVEQSELLRREGGF